MMLFLGVSSTPCPAQIRIMPVGDSITSGTIIINGVVGDGDGGYRRYLHDELTALGWDFELMSNYLHPNDAGYARMANEWLGILENLDFAEETISMPAGPAAAIIEQIVTFTSGGAESSLGHEVEYRFDWGDGTVSEWDSSSQSHSYSHRGTYEPVVQARCKIHTNIVSEWSAGRSVTISSYALNVMIQPANAGTVSIVPDKIDYRFMEAVQLQALASADSMYRFERGGGDVLGTENPITIIMDTSKSIIAHYALIREIISTPMAPVAADSGYLFDFWSGDTSGTDSIFTLIVHGDIIIDAHFERIVETISIPVKPQGLSAAFMGEKVRFLTDGSVSSQGHEVEYQYDFGDSSYSEWGFAVRYYTYRAVGQMEVSAPARVKSNSSIISEWSEVHTISISGCGLSISLDPLDAGTVCKVPVKDYYVYGDTVELTAQAQRGWAFHSWSGDLPGDNNPLVVCIKGDMNITAHFAQVTGVVAPEATIPEHFALSQNYPNPFNGTTTIQYDLPVDSDVNITVFNVHGQVVCRLAGGRRRAGMHMIEWGGTDEKGDAVPTGLYFCRIEAGDYIAIRRLILLE